MYNRHAVGDTLHDLVRAYLLDYDRREEVAQTLPDGDPVREHLIGINCAIDRAVATCLIGYATQRYAEMIRNDIRDGIGWRRTRMTYCSGRGYVRAKKKMVKAIALELMLIPKNNK